VQDPNYFKQLSVRDLLFLYYKCPQMEKKANFYSHYNMIVYTLNGKKLLHHQGKSWYMTDNTSLFVRKTAYNSERFYDAEWEVIAFYMPDDYLKKIFEEYRRINNVGVVATRPASMLIEVNINETTRAFFYSMIPYFNQQPAPSDALLELKFKELIFHILSNPANAPFLSYVSTITDQYKPSLQEIMEANFPYNLSLAEYAKLSHRSLASFKREFTEIFHTTPGKWLTEKRLHYATDLLRATDQPVNSIAYDCGFENSTHFSKIFKDKFGLSPLQYRKNKMVPQPH